MVKTSESGSSSTLSALAVSKQVYWPWPYYCNHRPRTLRIPDDIFKTINSAYILDTASTAVSSSSSSPTSSSPPLAATVAAETTPDASLESVIRLARSDRLFFDPGATSCSILDEASSSRIPLSETSLGRLNGIVDVKEDKVEMVAPSPYSDSVFLSVDSRDPVLDFRKSMAEMVAAHGLSSRIPLSETSLGRLNSIVDVKNEDKVEMVAPSPYSDSVFLSVDSWDPVLDFRKSMAEMVAAHGLKDWDQLDELLQWYLKVNDEANHSYIYGAFFDLLVSRAFVSANSGEANSSCSADSLPSGDIPCGCNYSPSSPLSFDTSSSSESSSSSSTRCVSGLETEDYDKEQCSATSSSSS